MALSANFRPTLLIGVGGTGIGIAERVFALAEKTEHGQRGRIGVLGFDTDTNDLRRLRAVDQRNQIALSTPDTIFQLLERNPEVEVTWFGPRAALSHDILNMTLSSGAAQIRILTRLALHHAIKRGGLDRRIGDAIARIGILDSRERFEGAVDVMMIGSLAGATGSGCFLQIALLVDQICRARNISADVRGLFLLPDIFVRGASLPTDQMRNVLANGYASLKELNAVNNFVTGRGDTTPFTFEYIPGHFLREGGLPFRSLALIDFENVKGGNLGRSLGTYQEMAARAAYQLIFTPIGQRTASVSINDARARLAAAAEGSHNLYAGVGVSAVVYPAEEMSRYLTLQLVTENLGGDWLRLDRGYFERVRRYEEQRRQGSLAAVRPDQGQAFLEDLEIFASKDRLAFFAEIQSRLNPKIRDERSGTEVVAPRHLTYLDAILQEVAARFWSRDRLRAFAARPTLDSSQLRNKAAVVDTVRRLEAQLTDDLGQIEINLATVPEDDFLNVLMTADDSGEAEWRNYHLQSYIIKDGPHLVEIRAFLYALRRALAERRQTLNVPEMRSRLMRAANVFDDTRGREPTERGSPRVIELAREAADRNIVQRLMKGSFEGFQADYATYYNGSLAAMRTYANQSIALKVLNMLDDEIQGLERYLSGLFVELDVVFRRLEQEAAAEEGRHGANRGTVDGNLWVFGDAAAKRQTWAALSLQSLGLRLGADANKTLAASVYQRYRADRRQRQTTDFASLGQLFTKALVEDFGRKTIENDFRGSFDFSVVEAIQREAALLKSDWKAYLQHVVDIVGAQSEPFLTLTDANDGQRVIFWAAHPKVRVEINDDQTYTSLFTFNQGEAPLEGEEFSDKELLCVNTRVNLELSHLAKLQPGDPRRTNINLPGIGSYAREYAAMVDGLIEAELSADARARDFTPHLDASWHRPGALPEMFPELTRAVRRDFARAAIVSLSLGLLEFNMNYQMPITEFSTVGRATAGGVHRRIAETHDLWEVLRVLDKRSEIVRAALRYWQEIERSLGAGPREPGDTLSALCAPEVVERVLRMAVVRDDPEEREERVRQLLAAWVLLVRDAVAILHRELAEPGRAAIVAQNIEQTRAAAFSKLRAGGVREETLRAIDRSFGTAVEELSAPARV
jgi:hypothetical protein